MWNPRARQPGDNLRLCQQINVTHHQVQVYDSQRILGKSAQHHDGDGDDRQAFRKTAPGFKMRTVEPAPVRLQLHVQSFLLLHLPVCDESPTSGGRRFPESMILFSSCSSTF